MAQTHPGYDIISRNPLTGEDRFIEVKGVNGEWNQTGVGLSRLQFSNAQDYGDRYWLYVVEFVSDPQRWPRLSEQLPPIFTDKSVIKATYMESFTRLIVS